MPEPVFTAIVNAAVGTVMAAGIEVTATNTGWCHLCREPVPTADLISHLCTDHPDRYEPAETWPDGGVLFEDQTLEPRDFGTPT